MLQRRQAAQLMTAYEGELLEAGSSTEAAAIADIAVQGVKPHIVTEGEVYAVPDGRGGVKFLDTDAWNDTPRRAAASRTVTDAASFVAYLQKHGTPATEVWADTPKSSVVAVIDAHEGAERAAGWQGHKLTLSLEKTPAWVAWNELSGKLVDQVDFAEFIENRTLDVKDPDAATLLEVANRLIVKKSVDFESGVRMQDGQTRLEYKETLSSKVGEKGHIDIPNQLTLVLKPYVGGPSYHVYARFRYRLQGSSLLVGVVLERPKDILDAAFADVVDAIRNGQPERDTWPAHDGITQPIFYGRP